MKSVQRSTISAFLFCSVAALGGDVPPCANVLFGRSLPLDAGSYLKVPYNSSMSLPLGEVGEIAVRQAHLVGIAYPILGTRTRVLTLEIVEVPAAWTGDVTTARGREVSRTLISRLEFFAEPPVVRVFRPSDLRTHLPTFPRTRTLVLLKHQFVQWVQEDLSVWDLYPAAEPRLRESPEMVADRAWTYATQQPKVPATQRHAAVARVKIGGTDSDDREFDRLLNLLENRDSD